MNLATFYRRYGTSGIARLAKEANVSEVGVRWLIYMPTKRPSLERAHKLIVACRRILPDGAECLTVEGLANPVRHPANSFEYPLWPMRSPCHEPSGSAEDATASSGHAVDIAV